MWGIIYRNLIASLLIVGVSIATPLVLLVIGWQSPVYEAAAIFESAKKNGKIYEIAISSAPVMIAYSAMIINFLTGNNFGRLAARTNNQFVFFAFKIPAIFLLVLSFLISMLATQHNISHWTDEQISLLKLSMSFGVVSLVYIDCFMSVVGDL
jgi:uncharacterized membrane protein (UPF0182 family)